MRKHSCLAALVARGQAFFVGASVSLHSIKWQPSAMPSSARVQWCKMSCRSSQSIVFTT